MQLLERGKQIAEAGGDGGAAFAVKARDGIESAVAGGAETELRPQAGDPRFDEAIAGLGDLFDADAGADAASGSRVQGR